MPETPPPGSGPRLLEAMPRPLLVVFALVCAAALIGAVVLIVDPPERTDVGLFDRRPPTAGDGLLATHDVGEAHPVVPPRTRPPFTAPCPEVEGVVVVAGNAGVARLRSMLSHACRLARGASDEVADAVRALARLAIRFASFERTGVESTMTYSSLGGPVLYLNVRFASTEIPVTHVVPILLHEAKHPRHPPQCPPEGPVCRTPRAVLFADEELEARGVEVEACRHLIPHPDWPRWCEDARQITAMPRVDALRALRAAGYR